MYMHMQTEIKHYHDHLKTAAYHHANGNIGAASIWTAAAFDHRKRIEAQLAKYLAFADLRAGRVQDAMYAAIARITAQL